MRKQIGLVALVVSVGILGWSWGTHKRTEEELNTVYYPILYSEVISAVDPLTKQTVGFDIRWHEEVGPGLKGTEPTRVLKYPDLSQSVTLVRRRDRKEYSFEICAPGYKDHTVTIKPADWYESSNVADKVLVVPLEPAKK